MLGEHQLLLFWVQLFVLLGAARGLGHLARRVGQPQVVGELAAGLLLGPSVLGRLAPATAAWLFPDDPVQEALLAAPAWIGAFLLLVATGFEVDLGLVRRLGRATARVVTGSLVVPVALGVAVGLVIPASFLGDAAGRSVFALFLGTALGVSALPVIAKILNELDLMRRNVAQVILAAAMADDAAGWILLGLVSGLAQTGRIALDALALTLGGLAAFLLLAFTAGQRALDALLLRARRARAGTPAAVSIAVCAALLAGAVTHAIGLEAVFGAFVAGIVLGRSRVREHEAFAVLQTASVSIFAPLFFASAGLRVDLGLLADPVVLGWSAAVLVVACGSKFGGAYVGARLGGLPAREGVALGVGLNTRGAVGIVVAAVGLSIGVLNGRSYTVVVLMALATSMMAPPLLRAVLRDWGGSDEERRRLDQERRLGGNVLVRDAPLLLPSHGGPNSEIAARLVDLAWPEGVAVTLFSAGADVPVGDLARVRQALSDRPVTHEHDEGREPLRAILEQAGLGYGAIALGATDARAAGRLVSPVVDELVAASPLPVVMVRRGVRQAGGDPAEWRRLLVPAVGTVAGRAAQELAFGLARRLGAEVIVAHVVTTPTLAQRLGLGGRAGAAADPERTALAEQVLEGSRQDAEALGVRAEPVIRVGVSAADEILRLARERHVDAVVVGANVRALSGRPFLGHGVEYLLERAEATVVVVTAPPGWGR